MCLWIVHLLNWNMSSLTAYNPWIWFTAVFLQLRAVFSADEWINDEWLNECLIRISMLSYKRPFFWRSGKSLHSFSQSLQLVAKIIHILNHRSKHLHTYFPFLGIIIWKDLWNIPHSTGVYNQYDARLVALAINKVSRRQQKIKWDIKVFIQNKHKYVKYLNLSTEKFRRDFSKASKGLEERLLILGAPVKVEDEQTLSGCEERTLSWVCPAAGYKLVRNDKVWNAAYCQMVELCRL